jgi:hypothetical protein
MKPSDFDTFAHMLNAIGDLYGKPQSEWSISLWWGALKHYDLAAVRDALNRHVQNPDTGQFMPKPADVVKMAQGSTMDAALIAWAKLDRGVRSVGTHRSVVFDDPLLHRVVAEMGGWIAFGEKREDEWPFVRNEFVNRYRGYRVRSELPDYPPVLTGIAEAGNGRNNVAHAEPPMLVGDPLQAQQVMRLGSGKPLVGVVQMDRLSALHALDIDGSRAEGRAESRSAA